MNNQTASYLTLEDGTLVDFRRDDTTGSPLMIHAGRGADFEGRPLVLTLTLEDARQMAMHLTGFIVTREFKEGRR